MNVRYKISVCTSHLIVRERKVNGNSSLEMLFNNYTETKLGKRMRNPQFSFLASSSFFRKIWLGKIFVCLTWEENAYSAIKKFVLFTDHQLSYLYIQQILVIWFLRVSFISRAKIIIATRWTKAGYKYMCSLAMGKMLHSMNID